VLHSNTIKMSLEEIMLKLAAAFVLLSSAAFARDKSTVQECKPIGQTASGELIYGMDCTAVKPENRAEVLSNMPPTNMAKTVVPKSGGTQNPEDTRTTGVDK
jgi:hypothetical protein